MTILPKVLEDVDAFEAAFAEDFGLDFGALPFEATALETVGVLAFTGKIAERDELDDQDFVDDGLILGSVLEWKIPVLRLERSP